MPCQSSFAHPDWLVGSLPLKDLPDWDWYEISAHLRCTKCGTVGYVDTRLNWSEVIDFNRGVC
jgi:hypothetical protein